MDLSRQSDYVMRQIFDKGPLYFHSKSELHWHPCLMVDNFKTHPLKRNAFLGLIQGGIFMWALICEMICVVEGG